MNLLIKFTENDKRLAIAVLLVLILVFVLIGYIGMLVSRLMKWQGKKVDDMMHDITVTQVVTNSKSFRKIAYKKSGRYFFKQAWIPIIILIVAFIILFICEAIHDFTYDIFNHETTGFGTLLFIWKDTGEKRIFLEFNSLEMTTTINLIHSPTFKVEAIWSYVFVPVFLTGAIWYLVNVQCLISRAFRIEKLSRKVYDKSMDNINMTKTPFNPSSLNQPPPTEKPPEQK
jgi:ABC-type multidrug transport system fused ATPase/permease subunit